MIGAVLTGVVLSPVVLWESWDVRLPRVCAGWAKVVGLMDPKPSGVVLTATVISPVVLTGVVPLSAFVSNETTGVVLSPVMSTGDVMNWVVTSEAALPVWLSAAANGAGETGAAGFGSVRASASDARGGNSMTCGLLPANMAEYTSRMSSLGVSVP